MPKSRRSRGGPRHRRDPITRVVKPPSDPRLAALRQEKVLPAVKDLSSADGKTRSAAAAAVANLAQDPDCRQLLLREQIVHTLLTQSLTDNALESRAAAWGILQLLAQEEGHDFCVHLYRQDILTSMDHAVKATLDKLRSNFDSLPKAEKSFVNSIAASLISLATALAEASEAALDAVAENGSIAELLGFVVSHPNPVADLRTDALACLMILSEDNPRFSEKFARGPHFQTVMDLKDKDDAEGVLACAFMHNTFTALDVSRNGTCIPEAGDAILVPTLTKAISLSTLPDKVIGSGWSNPVERQELALEVLASIGTTLACSPADDCEPLNAPRIGETTNGDAVDNDQDMADDDDMMNDLDMVAGADGDGGDGDGGIMPVLKALVQNALPQLVRLSSLESSGDIEANLRSLALSALSNIAWSASVIDFADGHNAAIRKLWGPAARSLWQQIVSPVLAADTADMAIAAQVTGLAWALARVLSGEAPLTAGEPTKFMTLYRATKGLASPGSDPFQGLGVKCVGVLGQLARDPAPVEVNREIGVFLLNVVAALPETPAADAVEALDQLFDIYGDEAHACDRLVFWKDDFLSRIADVGPKVRAMAKAVDKNGQPELWSRAQNASTNLLRFLVYKKKNRPS
ncbi:hypothetical protein CP533_1759 [Ophiocordyceps camponoti-saundersi (nom. inval.)]|nr:hypothetical protein CP533_1759 [Ophiocordyceps camponoti-saundersi (nom. inval.)]